MHFEQINKNITVVRDLDGLITLVVDLRSEDGRPAMHPYDWCKWARKRTTGIDDRFWDPLYWDPDIRHTISERLFSQAKRNSNKSLETHNGTKYLLESISEKVDTCLIYREIIDVG